MITMRALRNVSINLLLAVLLVLSVACQPVPVVTVQPVDVSPVATPISTLVVPPVGCSKASLHIGARPTGLNGFLEVARPCGIYALNNSPQDAVDTYAPGAITIKRVQNDKWGRLPDCMYCGIGTANWEAEARASARWEIQGKLQYVPHYGYLNYISFLKLSRQDFVAPLNEPVLGRNTGDYADKARWLNAWFVEWLTIAHANGLRGAIFSFPTGEPPVEAVPYLAPAARLAAQHGDVIDVHEYGINGGLQNTDDPENGAFGFARFYDALPVDARPRFVISEFSSDNGYDTGLHGSTWIADAIWYTQRLRDYSYVIFAAAFQLDLKAESNIPPDVLENYAEAASQVDWSIAAYRLYLPVIVLNLN